MVTKILKRAFFIIALIIVSPLIALAIIGKFMPRRDMLFQTGSQVLSLVPSIIGVYLRAAYFNATCNQSDREVTIGFATLLSHSDTDLDRHVYIGSQCNIGSCSIGKDCLLGSGVHVLSGKNQHALANSDVPRRNLGGTYEKIRIGENAWIGNNATILASIGDNCVVAAGSVVVDTIDRGLLVAGNPARVIRKIEN